MSYLSENKTDLALKLLVDNCGCDEVEEFKRIDTSDVVLSKRYYRKKRRILSKIDWAPAWFTFKKVAVRILAAILVLLSIGFATIMAVPSLRQSVLQTISQAFSDHDEIIFTDNDESVETEALDKIEKLNKPTVLPSGVEEENLLNGQTIYASDYYIGDEWVFSFQQAVKTESIKIVINTEDYEQYSIFIDTKELKVYESQRTGDICIFWTDEHYAYIVDGLDLDLMLDIISQIK